MKLELRPIRISVAFAALVLVATGLTWPQTCMPKDPETYMNDTRTIVDYLGNWDERKDQQYSILKLQSGTTLFASRDSAYYDVWRRTIIFQHSKHWPLYVIYNGVNHLIEAIYSSHPRKVTSVQIQPDGKAIVVFLPSPSFYFVNSNRTEAKKMIQMLQEAAKQQHELLIVNDPSTFEILDVRFPTQ